MINEPSPKNILRWFDPRHRKVGKWGFILNRLTALGMTLYLLMHLFMLGKLAQGPESYNAFIVLASHPLIKAGELLVIAAGFIHGLNGIRIALSSFGIGTLKQQWLLYGLMSIACVCILYFGYIMFFRD